MNWLIGILVTTIAGAIAHQLAVFFGGGCPGSWSPAVCAYWPQIAAAGGAVLGALGYGVVKGPSRPAGAMAKVTTGADTPPAPIASQEPAKRVTDVLPDAPAAGDAPAAQGATQPAAGAEGSNLTQGDAERVWSGP